jgi:hypothetical protein
MDMNVKDICVLCQHNIGERNQQPIRAKGKVIIDRDSKFIQMVEFCEPTIRRNPAALNRKLKQIYSGQKIKIQKGLDPDIQWLKALVKRSIVDWLSSPDDPERAGA